MNTIARKILRLGRVSVVAVMVLFGVSPDVRSQQIIPDSTLGIETSVVGDGIVDGNDVQLIEGGATRGGNLFHSFSDFNIGEGDSVYFANPVNIDNILSQVTGNSLSTIDGVLGVDGTANLFFLNPNGIIFGPEAQLDIAGSFTASTAGSFGFLDGGRFSTEAPETSLLSISTPLGIQRNRPLIEDSSSQLQSNISYESVLEVGQRETITLFGDTVYSNVDFSAPEGSAQVIGNRIVIRDGTGFPPSNASGTTEIFFQAADGITIEDVLDDELRFTNGTGQIVLNADTNLDGLGDVVMLDMQDHLQTNGRDLSVSGANVVLGTIDTTPKGFLTVVDIDAGGAIPSTGTQGTADFAFSVDSDLPSIEDLDVRFSAEHTYDGDLTVVLTSPGGTSITLFNGVGSSGENFQDTILDDEAITSIESGAAPFNGRFQPQDSQGLGIFDGTVAAGEWTLNVTDNAALDSGRLLQAGETAAWGTAAGTQLLLTTSVEGNSGAVNLMASTDIFANEIIATGINQSMPNDSNARNGAVVTVEAGRNIVLPRGVDTSTDIINGNGGTISISSVSGDISVGELNASSVFTTFYNNDPSSPFLGDDPGDSGDGGSIDISSVYGNITLEEASSVRSFTQLGESGNGGTVTISSDYGDISVADLNAFSSTNRSGDSGNGGAITISAEHGGNILTDGLSASSDDGGNGGDITVSSHDGTITTEGSLDVEAPNGGNGGTITIESHGGDITTMGRLFADANGGGGVGGNGGTISISSVSGDIETRNGLYTSTFSTFAGTGDAGTISISSDDGDIISRGFLRANNYTAYDDAGDGGNISISSISGDIVLEASIRSSTAAAVYYEGTYESPNTGNGGSISISTNEGRIIGNDIQLSSSSLSKRQSGEGGDITLQASSISGLELFTLSNSGQSGNVSMQNPYGSLTVENLQITTSGQFELLNLNSPPDTFTVDLTNVGQAGRTSITSVGDILLTDVDITGDANGSAAAGDIRIISPGQKIIFDNTTISSNANSDGDAGNILIEAVSLNLGAGDRLFATTSNNGRGGTITINTTESVLVGRGVEDSAPIISVEASGAGRPGNIVINTPNFVLSETARITATSTATAANLNNGGSIDLNANQMELAGRVGIFAETQGDATGGILTLQPYQASLNNLAGNNSTGNQAQTPELSSDAVASSGTSFVLTLAEGAEISASTTGSGNGGGLRLLAPEAITISGSGRLEVETESTGRAGNITATARSLVLAEGVTLSASTAGSGTAGDITFKIGDILTIDNSTVESLTELGSEGRGGSINVLDSGAVNLINGGSFSLNSAGDGAGGDLNLTAESLSLNDGSITATTVNSNGGNFNFNLSDYLLLRNGSLISTTAGTARAGGNGGSISINIPNGFIIAVPDENSDIRANAFEGNGGSVDITARNLLGIAFRPGLSDTPSSDITSSSEFGNSGTVTIDELNSEALQPEDELPVETAPATVARGCRAQGSQTGSFVNTGRGGLPTSPIDSLSANAVWQDLAPLTVPPVAPATANNSSENPNKGAVRDLNEPIIEAQAWQRTTDGIVTLLAERAEPAAHFSQAVVCGS